jgi:transcriptional regulator with XRE-family HTH domain
LVPRRDITARVSLGLAIRRLRKREGLNRRELARYAEIDHAALKRYERGDESPSFESLLAITGAMVVPLSALIGDFEHEHYPLKDE